LDAELNALKARVDNAIAFFYPIESSSGSCAPQMLDSLSTRSREIILTNMKQSVSSDEEAIKLIKDSAMMAGHIMDMLGVDMFVGLVMM
jgi:hypothetical protein